jgi:hypothetical protein
MTTRQGRFALFGLFAALTASLVSGVCYFGSAGRSAADFPRS